MKINVNVVERTVAFCLFLIHFLIKLSVEERILLVLNVSSFLLRLAETFLLFLETLNMELLIIELK